MTTTETMHPYATAPKSGRPIELWAEGIRTPVKMRWDADVENLLATDARGTWVALDGSMTWSDHDPDYAPTRWREIEP